MIFALIYFGVGCWFGYLSWDRRASDSQNIASLSLAILIWPLIVVAGLIVAGVRVGKK